MLNYVPGRRVDGGPVTRVAYWIADRSAKLPMRSSLS
jgi:hypothetical protein